MLHNNLTGPIIYFCIFTKTVITQDKRRQSAEYGGNTRPKSWNYVQSTPSTLWLCSTAFCIRSICRAKAQPRRIFSATLKFCAAEPANCRGALYGMYTVCLRFICAVYAIHTLCIRFIFGECVVDALNVVDLEYRMQSIYKAQYSRINNVCIPNTHSRHTIHKT